MFMEYAMVVALTLMVLSRLGSRMHHLRSRRLLEISSQLLIIKSLYTNASMMKRCERRKP